MAFRTWHFCQIQDPSHLSSIIGGELFSHRFAMRHPSFTMAKVVIWARDLSLEVTGGKPPIPAVLVATLVTQSRANKGITSGVRGFTETLGSCPNRVNFMEWAVIKKKP